MIRRSSSSTPSTCTSSDDRSGDRLTPAGAPLPVTAVSASSRACSRHSRNASKSSVDERTRRPRRQPVAPEHLVEDLAELGAHLLEVGGWRLPADADVRRPVDEAVIEDGVHRVPLPDAPQVGAREDVVVIDLARLDELRSERRARVEVARALQQGQRDRWLGRGPAAGWSPCATARGSTRMPGPPAARPRR